MGALFLIEVTGEQLSGLKRAACRTELEYERAIPQQEEAVAAFAAQNDECFLAMARENLASTRKWLALIRSAMPALYDAKAQPARNSSPFPRAALRPSVGHEATAAADLPPGGECGMSPASYCTDAGALEAQVLVSRESH